MPYVSFVCFVMRRRSTDDLNPFLDIAMDSDQDGSPCLGDCAAARSSSAVQPGPRNDQRSRSEAHHGSARSKCRESASQAGRKPYLYDAHGGHASTRNRDRAQGETHDITDIVAAAIAQSGCAGGLAAVFIVGSTAAVTTIEYEPGAVADLNRLFEEIAPREADYAITSAGATTTDRPRPRGAAGTVADRAVRGSTLLLGTWQQIMLIEFDTRPPERRSSFDRRRVAAGR